MILRNGQKLAKENGQKRTLFEIFISSLLESVFLARFLPGGDPSPGQKNMSI